MTNNASVRKEKIRLFAHILAGFTILAHGYEKYELQEHSYIMFFAMGILFISIALLHKKLVAYSHLLDSIFLIIEAICLAIIAADYFHAGKKALPWCYVSASIAYLVVAFFKYKKNSAARQSHARH